MPPHRSKRSRQSNNVFSRSETRRTASFLVADFLTAEELRSLNLNEEDFGPTQDDRSVLPRQGDEECLGQLVGGAVHQCGALVGHVVLRHPFPPQQLVYDLKRIGYKCLPAIQHIGRDH